MFRWSVLLLAALHAGYAEPGSATRHAERGGTYNNNDEHSDHRATHDNDDDDGRTTDDDGLCWAGSLEYVVPGHQEGGNAGNYKSQIILAEVPRKRLTHLR